ncbi:glycosyltransferase [Algoriphagus halophytocola]|uniref:Glycosyltransferase n=1 Tax=Algoriphagus halophytocola TaxID=2991499 RepID=A0ABY6MLG2_9BACT|nr:MULTISPECIES: glycosyltransferase [unclassified Algoriphagus]UZD24597.1 glycosyltransferase [Algoriphagus sp. TR-M5]WBL41965.1 glycosyltransferase [Algoriphagus sp. TR-M9]
MLSFYLIWSLSYLLLLAWLARFWPAKSQKEGQGQLGEITLLIPFRNEIRNAGKLAKSLIHLSKSTVQILLVDDHSEDESFIFLSEALKDYPNIRLVRSPRPGKKAAVEFGVSLARTELIVCSDADCSWSDFWLPSMVLPFQDPGIQFVAGPVLVQASPAFLSQFQQWDWGSILLLTQAGFAKQNPLMCSGANIAYRKSAFAGVEGYAGNRHFSSGDDEFLLKKMVERYGAASCVYLTHTDSLVFTTPEENWKALLRQRVRWAGKWRAKGSLSNGIAAGLVFVIQMLWIGSFGLLWLGLHGVLVFVFVWGIKFLGEKLALGKVLSSFKVYPGWFSLMKTTFAHPFYALAVGLGAIGGKFTWKGRQNARSVNLESEI